MKYIPPEGSKIKVEQNYDSYIFTWNVMRKGFVHYIETFVSLLALCLFSIFIFKIFKSEPNYKFSIVSIFIIIIFITFASAFLKHFYELYRSLRPKKKTKLTLSPERIQFYDCLFEKSYDIEISQLKNLNLERIDKYLRLSFDAEANRVDVGLNLTDAEKKWLYEILTDFSQNPQAKSRRDDTIKFEPPSGSIIKVERDMNTVSFTWPNGQKTVGYYFDKLPLIFFSLIWTFAGLFITINLLFNFNFSGDNIGKLAWVIFWIFSETYLLSKLYSWIKPLQPSKLNISSRKFRFETGTCIPDEESQDSSFFPKIEKNKIYEFDMSQLRNLSLKRVDMRLRLSFDYKAERIEIGEVLSEPEKEWLYQTLINSTYLKDNEV